MAGKITVNVLAILLAFAAGSVCAEDQNGMFAVKGVGVSNCEAYIAAAEEGERELAQYAGYLTGYFSAVNEVQTDTFDLLPWQHVDTLMLLMLQRCRTDPQKNFGSTVSEMARFFDQHKLTSMADQVRVGVGDDNTAIYEPVLAEIKAALERWGYPTVDLNASLKQFQRDQNMVGEGAFGQRTLLKLLYGQEDD